MISRHIKTSVRAFTAYDASERVGSICLDTNELRVPLPAAIKERLVETIRSTDLSRYPDRSAADGLRRAIALRVGVEPANIILGVGTSGLLQLVCAAIGEPGSNVLFPVPSFSMYPRYVEMGDKCAVKLPLTGRHTIDLALLQRVVERTKPVTIIVPYPNNPSGMLPSTEVVAYLLETFKGVLCVDEAYVDYCGESLVEEVHRRDNVVILRSFSKIGLASCRIGYLIACPELANALDRASLPYCVNAASAQAARILLENFDAVRPCIDLVISEREWLTKALGNIPGIRVFPSRANFVLCELESGATRIARHLLNVHGVAVRVFPGDEALAKSMRITVGTPSENRLVVQALRECGAS
jgi:histidinol-phosphate aminotransferase